MNELTMNLKSHSKTPLYEQIYHYIKTDIQSGRIAYKEKLPSTRALSKHLEVSRSTVELAYEQLLSEGYIESQPCRGFFVAQTEELYHLKTEKIKAPYPKQEKQRYRYDFSPNGVDLRSFPYNAWRKLTKDILMDDRTELFRSGDSKGEYGFRNAICSYLHQARGVSVNPSQVILGAGNDYLQMLLSLILGRENLIAMESPTYRHAYDIFQRLGYRCCTVSMDRYGISVEELQISGADIAYVMPSHQYPMGVVMPIKRRQELLQWAAAKEGRYIIEDDYDSEFR